MKQHIAILIRLFMYFKYGSRTQTLPSDWPAVTGVPN